MKMVSVFQHRKHYSFFFKRHTTWWKAPLGTINTGNSEEQTNHKPLRIVVTRCTSELRFTSAICTTKTMLEQKRLSVQCHTMPYNWYICPRKRFKQYSALPFNKQNKNKCNESRLQVLEKYWKLVKKKFTFLTRVVTTSHLVSSSLRFALIKWSDVWEVYGNWP